MVSIGNEQLGAMRQKMAIFKEGNSVCRGTFFSGALILCSERIAHFQKGVDSACLDHFGKIHSKKDGTLNLSVYILNFKCLYFIFESV